MLDLTDPAAAIAAATAQLDHLLVAGTPDQIAALFAEDAVLGESGMDDVRGRAAIRDFLAAANLVRAVTYHRVDRIELIPLGDRAIERGRFEEVKSIPGRPPITERGRTVTEWRRESDGAWRIGWIVVSDLPVPKGT